MTSTQLEQVKEFLSRVLERPGGERKQFLDVWCPDADVRQEVLRLLAAHDRGEGLMDAPTAAVLHHRVSENGDAPAGAAVGGPKPTIVDHEPKPSEDVPERIDRYRILRRISRGGMGAVYLAVRDDEQIRTQVAIKVIRRGMDTDDIVHRFRQEQQLLAALNHPNIARVMDAGVMADGRPYFVMEYVNGEPIDVYCDTQQLSIDERLELFGKVCSAVHFAHQNLIIHRDLKPSNILVGDDGEPKLLDFGIAKVVNPNIAGASLATEHGRRLMTPEYASPEQINGKGLTIATDVYSLGVVLYELLTGHSPYSVTRAMERELVRLISDVDPERPSIRVMRKETVEVGDGTTRLVTPVEVARTRDTRPASLRRRLSGDLDNIVLKAMRKLPRRRYQSAEQIAEDIDRHLDGMPVVARPDTVWYRSAKFIRRHRAGVAAAAIGIAIISGAGALSYAQWQRAQAALLLATAARSRADEWSQLLLEQIRLDQSFSLRGRAALLAKVQKRLALLEAHPSPDPELQLDIARAEALTGQLMGIAGPNLGQREQAVQHLSLAERRFAALVASNPVRADIRQEHLSVLCDLGRAQTAAGRTLDGEQSLRLAMEGSSVLLSARPDDEQLLRLSSVCTKQYADTLYESRRFKESMPLLRGVVQTRTALLQRATNSSSYRRDRTVAWVALAKCLLNIDPPANNDEAERYLKNALEDRRQLLRDAADDPAYPERTARRDLLNVLQDLAALYSAQDQQAKSGALWDEALPIARELARSDPSDTRSQYDLISCLRRLGNRSLFAGELSSATGHFQEALECARTLCAQAPDDTRARFELGLLYTGLAQAASGEPDPASAGRHAREARKALDAVAERYAKHDEFIRAAGWLAEWDKYESDLKANPAPN